MDLNPVRGERPKGSMVDFARFALDSGYELADWQLAFAERILAGENPSAPDRLNRHGEATTRALAALWKEMTT